MDAGRLKILYLTNIPAPYTVDFYNELGQYVDLTVLFERATADNREKDWFSVGGSNFHTVVLNGKKYGDEMALCLDVKKYLTRDYDLVIIGNYASLTGMISVHRLNRKKIPYAIHADGALIHKESALKRFVKKRMFRHACAFFSSGEVTDAYFKRYLKKDIPIFRYPFTSLRESDLTEHALSHSEKVALRSKSIFGEEYVILYVGSIIERKGTDILIKTAALLPKNTGVHIVGGDATEELSLLMERNRVTNVTFHPFAPKEQVLKYMRAADLFVFPTREDIWGLVVNEAMSQGVPVITSDKCGAGLELIQDSFRGSIVRSEDPILWAQTITEYLENADKLDRASIACLEYIKDYTIEKMAKIYFDAIKEICENHKRDLSRE